MFAATFSELLTLDIQYPSTSSCNRDPDEFQELGQSRKLQQFNDSLGQLNHKLFVSPDIDRNPIRLRARAFLGTRRNRTVQLTRVVSGLRSSKNSIIDFTSLPARSSYRCRDRMSAVRFRFQNLSPLVFIDSRKSPGSSSNKSHLGASNKNEKSVSPLAQNREEVNDFNQC